ncbi:CAP domain-containing protein [Strongyloides ratti]|uniref:CAP domain-containing protein n=1 Tax=Strongyloides ratti TaxID=34506 RepID=A0A090MZU8_STRRB|nr:CAP domain-containing protein [Strongyloides ratti]CEF69559.2 CAP domain-containing protein [Strongyloides ratti]
MVSFYRFTFILFGLVNITYQVILVGYYIQMLGKLPTYEYNNVSFPSVKKMVKAIVADKNINYLEHLLIFVVGFKRGRRIDKNYDVTCEKAISYLSEKYINKFYKLKNECTTNQKTDYTCANKHFNGFDYAVDYMMRSNCHINAPSNTLQPVLNDKSSFLPKDACIILQSGKKFLKDNLFSNKIWYKHWHRCDEYCYLKKDFASTKLKYFLEINDYRRQFGLKPLRFKNRFNLLAQSRAKELSRGQQTKFDFDKTYSEITGFSYITYAKFYLKIMFDDAYMNKSRRNSLTLRDIEPLMDRNTMALGIGITTRGDKVFIVIICE